MLFYTQNEVREIKPKTSKIEFIYRRARIYTIESDESNILDICIFDSGWPTARSGVMKERRWNLI